MTVNDTFHHQLEQKGPSFRRFVWPSHTKATGTRRQSPVRNRTLWTLFVAIAVLAAACAEQSFVGEDLAPELPTTSIGEESTAATGLSNSLSGEAAPAATTTTSTPPATEQPAPNPADLGRTSEAGVFYVSPTGDDNNEGTLPSEAFGSVNFAAAQLEPGDELLLLEGTYEEEWRPDTSIMITAKGTPDAWITITAFPGHDVAVLGPQRNSFKLEGAEYVELGGFELIGSGTELLGAGVHIENPSHHITIFDNVVHGFPAGGINVTGSSHITIAGNEVFDNARFHPGQHSGISMWRPQNLGFPDGPLGYSNVIVGNRVYGNQNTVPGELGITDGNCVILDELNLTGYAGRTLIANNVCFDNGGRAVQIHKSQRADVVNNTGYANLTSTDLSLIHI